MKNVSTNSMKLSLLVVGFFMILGPTGAEAHEVKALKKTYNPELLKKSLDHSFRERDVVNRNYRKHEVVARPEEPILEDPVITLEVGDELGSRGVNRDKLKQAKKKHHLELQQQALLSDE